MQILLANAKKMHSTGSAELFERAERVFDDGQNAALSTPLFLSVANQLAAEMAQMSTKVSATASWAMQLLMH